MLNHRPPSTKDIRERIIEESIRLLGTNGFGGTSIQMIADAVGIRKPSLLYHFGSKEELRNQVYESLLGHWKNELPRLLSGGTRGYDQFSSTITALVNYFLEDTNRARLAIREMLDRPEEVRLTVKDHLAPWVKLVTDYIRLGQKVGIIRPDVDPESYVLQVIMMVIGTVAVGNIIAAMFEKEGGETLSPLVQELERIARQALFVKPTPPKLESEETS